VFINYFYNSSKDESRFKIIEINSNSSLFTLFSWNDKLNILRLKKNSSLSHINFNNEYDILLNKFDSDKISKLIEKNNSINYDINYIFYIQKYNSLRWINFSENFKNIFKFSEINNIDNLLFSSHIITNFIINSINLIHYYNLGILEFFNNNLCWFIDPLLYELTMIDTYNDEYYKFVYRDDYNNRTIIFPYSFWP